MKNIILFLFTGLLTVGLMAQKNTIEEIKVKTSAQCDMCKKTIEDGLYNQKGIVQAVLDVPTKIVTIKFRPTKVTADQIRIYISKLGYDADEVVADQAAHDNLPGCCQKGSSEHK